MIFQGKVTDTSEMYRHQFSHCTLWTFFKKLCISEVCRRIILRLELWVTSMGKKILCLSYQIIERIFLSREALTETEMSSIAIDHEVSESLVCRRSSVKIYQSFFLPFCQHSGVKPFKYKRIPRTQTSGLEFRHNIESQRASHSVRVIKFKWSIASEENPTSRWASYQKFQ